MRPPRRSPLAASQVAALLNCAGCRTAAPATRATARTLTVTVPDAVADWSVEARC